MTSTISQRQSRRTPERGNAHGEGTVPSTRSSSNPEAGEAKAAAAEARQAKARKKPLGAVAFVGTGPGDPTLLTLRAADRLSSADAVVIDEMPELDRSRLLARCRPGVEVRDVPADPEGTPLAAAARVKLIAELARAGKSVVRLLRGDPGMSGDLAEEATGCVKGKVPFEIVPGVSAMAAWPEYAGIPLATATNSDVRVVRATADVEWAEVGAGRSPLVLIGAATTLGPICTKLMRAGRPDATPVAIIAGGTTSEQQTAVSTLGRLAAAPASEVPLALRNPTAITVVGEVVALRDKLSWFESKPLFGWRVLVPRTKEQAGQMSAALVSYGAVPEEVPTIAVEPPRTPQQMERAIKGLVTGRYEWIAFTSRNAVRAIREKLEEYGLDARAFSGIKVAAVGERTAEDLLAWGIKPDLVPIGDQSSKGLLEDWPAYDSVLDPIDRVFLPRADIATETLAAGLQELGWEVDDVTAYRTVRASPPPPEVREAIKGGSFDAVLFTSSSTVRNLVGIAGKPHSSTVIACIGPQTVATAEDHGLRVDVMASTPSAPALAEALAEFANAARAAALAAGEPATPGSLRPSRRRSASRRRAT